MKRHTKSEDEAKQTKKPCVDDSRESACDLNADTVSQGETTEQSGKDSPHKGEPFWMVVFHDSSSAEKSYGEDSSNERIWGIQGRRLIDSDAFYHGAGCDSDDSQSGSVDSRLSAEMGEYSDLLDVAREIETNESESSPVNSDWTKGCRSIRDFRMVGYINEGGYGIVYKAMEKTSGKVFALKRIKSNINQGEGFPTSTLREICLSRAMCHPNIVNVHEVVVSHRMENIYLVMELMETDLYTLMKTSEFSFNEGDVKSIMTQLLRGLGYLHENWAMHRDVKPSNLLVNSRGVVKLSDFGLARIYESSEREYSEQLVTLWYRPPEILNGIRKYSYKVDMWAVGCIFAELFIMRPLFKGKSELDQLDKIYSMLGTLKKEDWPEFFDLRPSCGVMFIEQNQNRLSEVCTEMPQRAFDIIANLLNYNPNKRMDCSVILEQDYFQDSQDASELDRFDISSFRCGINRQRRITPEPSPKSVESEVYFPDGADPYKELCDGLDSFGGS